ncbi:MAG: NAD(P)H-dependent oxidoreductase subunit E [Methanobacteriota archaeon]
MDVKDRFVIDTVLEKYKGVRDPALIILQNIQAVLGYVGKDYLEYVAEKTDYSLTELYGIVTFYPSFRLEPPGKHTIKVCQGTACHVRGGEKVLKAVEELLEIKPGGTTKDRLFSLESVRCLGCCGLSPVIMIDNETYGRVKPAKLNEILTKYGEAGE